MPSPDPLDREGDRTHGQCPEAAPSGAELHPRKKGEWKPDGCSINQTFSSRFDLCISEEGPQKGGKKGYRPIRAKQVA